MAILRRALLSVVLASPAIAAPADAVRAERSLGSPEARLTSIECFSLTCPHCADFALKSLPELRAEVDCARQAALGVLRLPNGCGRTPGRHGGALSAAGAVRALHRHAVRQQDHWVFGAGSVSDTLWALAKDAGMDRATFERALADDGLRDWIVGQALDAQKRWHVDATPSFVINGRLYAGALSASEFATILAS